MNIKKIIKKCKRLFNSFKNIWNYIYYKMKSRTPQLKNIIRHFLNIIKTLFKNKFVVKIFLGFIIFSIGVIYSYYDMTWKSFMIGMPIMILGFLLILMSD